MARPTFTPEPWRRAKNLDPKSWPFPAIQASNGHMLAQVCMTGRKGEANVTLMIAAPALYAALDRATRELQILDRARITPRGLDRLVAGGSLVLAQARGER